MDIDGKKLFAVNIHGAAAIANNHLVIKKVKH